MKISKDTFTHVGGGKYVNDRYLLKGWERVYFPLLFVALIAFILAVLFLPVIFAYLFPTVVWLKAVAAIWCFTMAMVVLQA